jgi:hypothetical protein
MLCCVGRAQYGRTPLYIAAEKGHASVVTALLEKGADKDVNDNVRPACARARARTHAALHIQLRALPLFLPVPQCQARLPPRLRAAAASTPHRANCPSPVVL